MTSTKPLDRDPLSPLRRELLSLLRCPEDQGLLFGWDSLSPEGVLSCSDCGRTYPIRNGVPCLLPDGLRETSSLDASRAVEFSEKQSEMAARDAQSGDYDRMLGLKLLTLRELPLSLRYLSPQSGSVVLEGGCGTGRMTEMFARNSRLLIAMDFSAESIQAARRKLPTDLHDRVLFIQADLSRLPLQTEAFDRVGSFGVYQHLPTPEARERAMGEMARTVKTAADGGRFAYSAYRWGAPINLFSQREGHHPGGIYYYRFTGAEFREQAAPRFDVKSHSESLMYYHILSGEKKN